MARIESVRNLWERIKRGRLTHDDLVRCFEDYQELVMDCKRCSESYRTALRNSQNEFLELSRLSGHGHDEVFRGRLIDAIASLRKNVERLELSTAGPLDPAEAPVGDIPMRNFPG